MISKIRTRRVYNLEAFSQKVDNITNKLVTAENKTKFKATLKGQEYIIDNFKMIDIDYTKRDSKELAQLRNKFNNKIRGEFLRNLSQNESYLKQTGFSDTDIKYLKLGLPPDGWQVHHKLPLDDGGTNSLDNLVLIKNDPYHLLINNYQRSTTGKLKSGDSIKIKWPYLEGTIYPVKP